MNTPPAMPDFGPRPSLARRALSAIAIGAPITRTLLIAVGIALLIGWAGFATQTIRLDGLQLRLPFIGTIGPQGWRPYALELEGEVTRVTLERDQANANHRQTKENYRAAQEEANRRQAEEVARIEREHKETINEIRHRFAAAVSGYDDRARRMREQYLQARSAAGRAPGDLPGARSPDPGLADEAPGCYGISGRRTYLAQIECDRIASNQAEQLRALQELVLSLPGVRVVEGQ